MKRQRTTQRDHEHGAAALLVVIVLFFILAMVTAYAGRNLIFEQRTSVSGLGVPSVCSPDGSIPGVRTC